MRYFGKALTWLLGGLLAIYVILCITYLTINLHQMEIVQSMTTRAVVAIASALFLLIATLVLRDNDKPKDGYDRIQHGGAHITEESLNRITKDIRQVPNPQIWVERRHDGRYYTVYIGEAG